MDPVAGRCVSACTGAILDLRVKVSWAIRLPRWGRTYVYIGRFAEPTLVFPGALTLADESHQASDLLRVLIGYVVLLEVRYFSAELIVLN